LLDNRFDAVLFCCHNPGTGGTYFLQNDRVGYLVTAGDPSLPQGTPRPLRVEVVESSVGHEPALLPILEDIFKLAQLNWSSPEGRL